jgi:HEAT repeat protein
VKSISIQTKALIEQLNPPVSFWERITGRRDDADLLLQIGLAGEPAAVVDIIPFVLSESREVARAAADAVDKLLVTLLPHELAQLDSIFRVRSPYLGRYRMEWHKLMPSDLSRLESCASNSVALLGLASFHSSGYVREEAVRRLDRMSGGAELPFLLIRQNDWVQNVREAALRAVTSRLSPSYAVSFAANLPLVTRLEQTERADHRQFVKAIGGLLKSPECRDALLTTLDSPDRLVRRSGFKLAVDATGSDLSSIMERALSDEDTVIRLWAARKIASDFAGAVLDKFLALMRRDRFMPVRREALRAFVSRLPERAPQELRRALLDTHASMREEARYQLRKTENIDVASFYRQALKSDENVGLYAAVSGLGESGSASDDTLLIEYTQRESAKVRSAAIKALSRLNGGEHHSTFINALQDEMPGVSREARKALSGRLNVIGGEPLWEIFNSSTLPFVRRNVMYLFSRLGKWDSIYFLTKAAADSDDEIAERSRLYIGRWLMRFNLSFSAPSREQLARLEGALAECGHVLNENVREQVWFSMKGF